MRKQQPNAAIVSKGISAGNRSLTPMPPTSVEHSAPPFGRHRFGRVCKADEVCANQRLNYQHFPLWMRCADLQTRPPLPLFVLLALYWSVEPATCWLGRGSRRATGVADASVPHSALRKSFHFMPLSVPAVCAALYWHCAQASSAPSDELPKAIAPRSAPVQMATRRVVMAGLPCADLSDKSPIAAVRH
jgi:hypothetical protein